MGTMLFGDLNLSSIYLSIYNMYEVLQTKRTTPENISSIKMYFHSNHQFPTIILHYSISHSKLVLSFNMHNTKFRHYHSHLVFPITPLHSTRLDSTPIIICRWIDWLARFASTSTAPLILHFSFFSSLLYSIFEIYCIR